MSYNVLLYGAAGHSGERIARQAAKEFKRGRLILAGRSGGPVRKLAEELGLHWRAFELDDYDQVLRGLIGVDLVVNAAGPFVNTAVRLANASIQQGCSYVDINGEIDVYMKLDDLARKARSQNVALVCAAGHTAGASCILLHHALRAIAAPFERLIGEGGRLQAVGKQSIVEGQQRTEEGERLADQGRELRRQGEQLIREGRRLISEGDEAKGRLVIEDGKKRRAEGGQRARRSEQLADAGKQLATEGRRLARQGKQRVEEGEQLRRERKQLGAVRIAYSMLPDISRGSAMTGLRLAREQVLTIRRGEKLLRNGRRVEGLVKWHEPVGRLERVFDFGSLDRGERRPRGGLRVTSAANMTDTLVALQLLERGEWGAESIESYLQMEPPARAAYQVGAMLSSLVAMPAIAAQTKMLAGALMPEQPTEGRGKEHEQVVVLEIDGAYGERLIEWRLRVASGYAFTARLVVALMNKLALGGHKAGWLTPIDILYPEAEPGVPTDDLDPRLTHFEKVAP